MSGVPTSASARGRLEPRRPPGEHSSTVAVVRAWWLLNVRERSVVQALGGLFGVRLIEPGDAVAVLRTLSWNFLTSGCELGLALIGA